MAESKKKKKDQHLVKRGKNWYITYQVKENGKRKLRMEVVGTRKDDAEDKLKEYQELLKRGIDPRSKGEEAKETESSTAKKSTVGVVSPAPTSNDVPTLEEFLETFLKLHGENQSNGMQESYKSSLKHLMPTFGKLRLDKITKVMVQEYMKRRLTERIVPYEKRVNLGKSTPSSNSETKEKSNPVKRKPRKAKRKKKKLGFVCEATVNREVACLKVILSKAAFWEYIPKNPIHGLESLKEAPIRERYLTREEYQRLLLVAPNYLRDIIVFALATGMRQDEIFGLKWESIILNERFRHGEITFVGKGNKRRSVRMNQTVYELLARKRRERKGEYVFTSPKTKAGKKLDNVSHSFSTALEKAGITNFRFHDLRHTAASWMVQGGADIYAVQKILGHADLKTTQRYAHQSPEYLESQIGILDGFLEPKKDSNDDSPMGVAV